MLKRTIQLLTAGVLCTAPAFAGSYSDTFPNGEFNGLNLVQVNGTTPQTITNTLVLTTNGLNLYGAALFTVKGVDLDSGSAIDTFTATFDLILGPGTSPPADGFGFCFGPDVNWVNVTNICEEGINPGGSPAGQPNGGIAVTIDTYNDNTSTLGQPGDPVAIEVWVGANNTYGYNLVAAYPMVNTTLVDGVAHPVAIQMTRAGFISVAWNNQIIFTNLFVPGWAPVEGYFGAGARTGGLSEYCGMQNLNIATTVGAAAPTTVTIPPANTTVSEGSTATFSVVFDGEAPLTIQWYKGATAIPNATNSVLTLSRVLYTDNGAQITAQIGNGTTTVTSSPATLTVIKSTTPPTVVSALADATYTTVTLTFSKPIGTAGTYTITGGGSSLAVSAANISAYPNDNVVVLTTAKQGQGVTYTITINGTKDEDATPNTIAAGTTIQFQSYVNWPGIVRAEFWNNIGGAANLTGFTNNAHFQDPPDLVTYWTSFYVSESAWVGKEVDDYGTVVTGWITPPTTDDYVFYLSSDDNGAIWLSTDATPANLSAQPIAHEDSWDNNYELGPTNRTSNPIPLTKGNLYYFYALAAQGGGGDHLGITMSPSSFSGDPDNLGNLTYQVVTPISIAGTSVSITQQPYWVKGPVVEGSMAPMATYATGYTPYLVGTWGGQDSAAASTNNVGYQWYENGSPIAGATKPILLQTMTVAHDNNAVFTCVCTVPGINVTSSPVTLQVVADTFPASIVSASAFPGSTTVGIEFSKDLDPVTGGNAANYTINGKAVTAALIRTNLDNELTNENNLVELIVPTPLTADFTVGVTGIKAANNGVALTTNNFAGHLQTGLTYVDVGTPVSETVGTTPSPDPLTPGIYRPWGADNFDIIAGGCDYYNNADGFGYLYTMRTNSFDIAVRIVAVAPECQWSAAGLVMRESLSQYSREYHNKVCPPNYGTNCYEAAEAPFNGGGGAGSDDYELNCRLATGDPTLGNTSNSGTGGSVGWGGTAGPGAGAPAYPNAWIRVKRIRSADGSSDHYQGYGSSDGINWNLIQDVDLNDAAHAGVLEIDGVTKAGPWPTNVFIGMGTTAHCLGWNTNTASYTAVPYPNIPVGGVWMCATEYRNFGDYAPLVIPPLSAPSPTLSYTVTGGVLMLNWTGGNLYTASSVLGPWSKVSGASSPYTVTTKGSFTGFYRSGP